MIQGFKITTIFEEVAGRPIDIFEENVEFSLTADPYIRAANKSRFINSIHNT